MKHEHPIIERPELQTPRQRFGGLLVTIAAWTGWLYLWVPATLLSAVWAFRDHLIHYDPAALEADGYWTGALLYGSLCSVCALLLVSWTLLDTLRDRRNRRLPSARRTEVAELALDFGLRVHLVTQAQTARNLVLHFTQDGRIEHIEIRQRPFEEERMAG
jgi:poly-beta-1,6-N-acetyl-D-glucosamine biosynthesis protein PgaD